MGPGCSFCVMSLGPHSEFLYSSIHEMAVGGVGNPQREEQRLRSWLHHSQLSGSEPLEPHEPVFFSCNGR